MINFILTIKKKNSESKSSNEASGDIEKMLKEELDGLNSRDKEFTVIDTGAKYTLFISLSSVDSNQVAKSIYQVRKY